MSKPFLFEEGIKRLEEIVVTMEKGEATLEQSLALYEEGTTLIRKCEGTLDKAEMVLKQLLQTAEGPQEADFVEQE